MLCPLSNRRFVPLADSCCASYRAKVTLNSQRAKMKRLLYYVALPKAKIGVRFPYAAPFIQRLSGDGSALLSTSINLA
jgi:hypothetical protein